MFVKSCSEHITIVIRGIGSSSAITYSKGIHIYSREIERERERIIVYLVEFVEYFNNTINEQTHTHKEREREREATPMER